MAEKAGGDNIGVGVVKDNKKRGGGKGTVKSQAVYAQHC